MTTNRRLLHLTTEALRLQLSGVTGRVPDAAQLPWRWFLELSRTRTSNGYGPNPITLAEIDAFARLYRWPTEPRHVDLILAMDRVWLEHAAQRRKAAVDGQAMVGAPDVTSGALAAIFGG